MVAKRRSGRSRTAAQKAALKKAQAASARKRRRGGRKVKRKPGGPSKKGYAISFGLGGLPGAIGYHYGAKMRERANYPNRGRRRSAKKRKRR